ncbi:MAG: N-acetylmuramic acid 6-phosphate etherase [Flavobacteriaceae bacterium]
MDFNKITEENSNYNDLEKKSIDQLTKYINNEDQSVANSVKKELFNINKLIEKVIQKLKSGGRLFYIGSGTSGRLGVVDASECPPTFGVDSNLVIGVIAGGDKAIRKSIENAEDDKNQGWKDLESYNICPKDFVVGISASGTTPYVISALINCNKNNVSTGCITCNRNSTIASVSRYPIEVVVGPELITGSSRMKAGTAQKLILNMISSVSMIKMGKVLDNKMVDMQLSNLKLIDRGKRMLMEKLSINELKAEKLLKKYKSVRKALKNFQNET